MPHVLCFSLLAYSMDRITNPHNTIGLDGFSTCETESLFQTLLNHQFRAESSEIILALIVLDYELA